MERERKCGMRRKQRGKKEGKRKGDLNLYKNRPVIRRNSFIVYVVVSFSLKPISPDVPLSNPQPSNSLVHKTTVWAIPVRQVTRSDNTKSLLTYMRIGKTSLVGEVLFVRRIKKSFERGIGLICYI